MTSFLIGPNGAVPAGYARCPAGTVLLRGHSPGVAPDWFGPAVGESGINRFDMPYRRTASDPGTCYLAPELDGVILERIIRDVRQPFLSRRRLLDGHAVTSVLVTADLILVDLLRTPWTVHGVQASDVNGKPLYAGTQALAARWAAATNPVADGILYGSRFGSGVECVALWDRVANSLDWYGSQPLGHDANALARSCGRLGIGLLP